MLKNMTRLESIVNFPIKDAEGKEVMIQKIGHFFCDNDVPLHVVKEMLFQFQKYVGSIEDAAKAQYEAQLTAEKEESNKIKECCQENGELCLVKE